MKNLAYYKSLAKDDESVLCLMEPHISGGTISIERINQIRHHPDKILSSSVDSTWGKGLGIGELF